MLTRYFLALLPCAAATAAQALTPPLERRPPPRMILSDAAAQPIQLQQLDISAEISGGMAETLREAAERADLDATQVISVACTLHTPDQHGWGLPVPEDERITGVGYSYFYWWARKNSDIFPQDNCTKIK